MGWNSDVDVLVQESYSRMNLTQVKVCDSRFRALVLSVREHVGPTNEELDGLRGWVV